MIVDLPYPDKALWPNGRAHWAQKARQAAKHRAWAYLAALEVKPEAYRHSGETMPVTIRIFPKRYGPVPDKDNIIAASKAFLDGIADALGVNDQYFAAPVVEIDKERDGRFAVEVGT